MHLGICIISASPSTPITLGSSLFLRVIMSKSIPFNKAPFFRDEFSLAVDNASNTRHFSGDGKNSKDCCQFFKMKYGYERSLLTPSCTASLEMAALMLDLGPGDEVIVPSFTFVTSANAFALRGVNVVFADSESDSDSKCDSPNVSVSDIVRKVTDKTKAIVVVHYAGVPVDVSRLIEETNGSIPIVEDCAHAIGSIDPKTGDFVGKLGCASTFSFHETKNVAIGEGGLLVVNDDKLWLKAQIIREKGTNRTEFKKGNVPFYSWVGLGSSYLMSEIDAAMLWSVLQNIDKVQNRRLEVWDAYDKNLVQNSLFYKPKTVLRANAHMYFLKFKDEAIREKFVKTMSDEGIVVAKHYIPLHDTPFVKNQPSYKNSACPHAVTWSNALVRLPLFYDLTDEKLMRVINAVNDFSLKNGYQFHEAREEYWDDILDIRNQNGAYFLSAKPISKENHLKFMTKHQKTYYVVTELGKCVGFVGRVKDDFRLGTCKKGGGVGEFLVDMWIQMYGRKIGLKCIRSNTRLIGFARKLGFFPVKESWETGEDPLRLTYKTEGGWIDVMQPKIMSKL